MLTPGAHSPADHAGQHDFHRHIERVLANRSLKGYLSRPIVSTVGMVSILNSMAKSGQRWNPHIISS